MKPPFDISGDLDTPVSAYMKLASFSPRFLLESVEGGERLARYSFIGFGDGLEVKLDRDGLTIGRERRPIPANSVELLDALRHALKLAPTPQPNIEGVPLAGGLVGYSSYDVVRFFERLPARTKPHLPREVTTDRLPGRRSPRHDRRCHPAARWRCRRRVVTCVRDNIHVASYSHLPPGQESGGLGRYRQ